MTIVNASYTESIGEYRDNPFIEALPRIYLPDEVINALKNNITFSEAEKNANSAERGHLVAQLINSFFQPIHRHIELENKISIMLRKGYVGRNINDGSLNKHIQNTYEKIKTKDDSAIRFETSETTASSMAFIGCSGIGKSTSLNKILSLYPEAIYHEKYNFTQIVYLNINCPHDGSLKSLCFHFFRAVDRVLDTNYENKYAHKRNSVEKLLNLMKQIANLHAIGMLVIDEIQHLSINKNGGAEKMLNFFVTLVNTICLPVIMVGTPKARFIFEGDFRSARRGAGFGSIFWEQIKQEPSLTRPDGTIYKSDWVGFTDRLWKFQWLKEADVVISEDIRSLWYELSQGIIDIVIKLFVMAQLKAIEMRLERITLKLLEKTYQDDFKPIHRMIEALQSGRADRIAEFSDLVVPDIDRKLLSIQSKLSKNNNEPDDVSVYEGHEQSIALHRMLLGLGYDSSFLVSFVKGVIADNPDAPAQTLMLQVLTQIEKSEQKVESTVSYDASKQQTAKSININQWHTLDTEDIRFQFSQKHNESFYEHLKQHTYLICDVKKLILKAG